MPKVSIIIANFNGEKFLKSCLDSIKKGSYKNLEVIIVDNDSADESREIIKRNYPWVRLVENKTNLGFCLANNHGAGVAKGSLLFFLNNDTRLEKETISKLVKKMEQDRKIGICGCRMMDYEGKKTFHSGIGLDIFGFPINKGKLFYVEGSALMIRKRLFSDLGGFDAKYFMFHEDVDLAWRSYLLGYKVAVEPGAIVYHAVGSSAGGRPLKGGKETYRTTYLRRYYSERNNIRTLLKNYQFYRLLLVLPIYLLINCLEIAFFAFSLNFKGVYLYLKAYLWNFVQLKDTLSLRFLIQRTRKVSDVEIAKKMFFGFGKFFALKKVGLPKFK